MHREVDGTLWMESARVEDVDGYGSLWKQSLHNVVFEIVLRAVDMLYSTVWQQMRQMLVYFPYKIPSSAGRHGH